tara:strand:+ start:95 stop:1150 length:1056 start_codon:yes stop_codon:yes gene_type:complete
MKTILITGGAGFIGSHTCVELINNGHNVCIIDSLINSSEKIILDIKETLKLEKTYKKGELFFRKGDLRNKKFLFNVFNEFKKKFKMIDAVIHFAGLKSVEESCNEPLKYWDANINSTLSLLEIMNTFNCYSIVFSSSATIYKPQGGVKLKESSPKGPINPYGYSKLTNELILENLFRSNPNLWKIANLRYFNPAGAHTSGYLGENPLNKPTNLFPIILDVAMSKNKELSIFGNDWPTKDGTCIRDYIHVMDLAEAHSNTLDYLMKNDPQIISLNIGTGSGTSVLEIVNKFIEVNKVEVPYKFRKRRDGDADSVVADNSLASDILKWKPKRNIHDMCFDSWKWINASMFKTN